MESLARYLATMASQRWPMPLQILSQHMTPLFKIQVSHQPCPQYPVQCRSFQLLPPEPATRVPPCQGSLLQDLRAKALQHMLRLKMEKALTRSLPNLHLSYPSSDARIVQRREPLGQCSTSTSKLILSHTGAIVVLGKPHNGTSIVIKILTERFASTSVQYPDAPGTIMVSKAVSRDDWTTQRDISSHTITAIHCLY